ncbi:MULTISPECIES: BlaI/MecI/CopY family transcriptional regulator [Myroides]|uniref:BlaI/MecI/CopY family transcriptional regulator n=1 Tax=Myroides albus TaxID=2562892 RepID=A0A6I3LN41_9FLAO|nr:MULTISPECIES: BlaI/MecI/CopY family transcriptional regulator [Myroides]MTG97592.1 BlaI/MecI/CopY family transcriptional regulator [Myroides albus]MVX36601.1 BlaI/MecI/CopY family transcriptional regulator [Myroides sp. LoEW2-1]UVD79223.1 BlaI/MecI/CopY family transcriptional regulator [Myroides albus]
MEKLTNKEEEIMRILWKIEKGFINDILQQMDEPKPHYNTLSTLVRILEDKGVVAHHTFGKSHQYYPLVDISSYKKQFMEDTMQKYFDNSFANLVNFFVKDKNISKEELDEISALIEKNRK